MLTLVSHYVSLRSIRKNDEAVAHTVCPILSVYLTNQLGRVYYQHVLHKIITWSWVLPFFIEITVTAWM